MSSWVSWPYGARARLLGHCVLSASAPTCGRITGRIAWKHTLSRGLLTAINFIPPAIARIPIASLQALGPIWFFGFPTSLTLLCLTLDTRRFGRVNRVFAAARLC